MKSKRVLLSIIAATVLGAIPVRAGGFYDDLLTRAKADFDLADYARAADEFKSAAFGFLDDIPRLETANVYAAVAAVYAGRPEDAASAARQIALAERIAPTYQSLDLPPALRKAFESSLTKLFTAEQLASLGTFWASSTAGVINESLNELRSKTAQAPDSIPLKMSLAEAELAAGNTERATQLANELLALDENNAAAHVVLARVASAQQDFANAIAHYERATGQRALTERDTGRLFVAYVETGNLVEAARLQDRLTLKERNVPEVQRAMLVLHGKIDG